MDKEANWSIQVGIVDDHKIFRDGITIALKKEELQFTKNVSYKIVLTAENGHDMVRKIQGGATPEVIILDIRMSEMDGYKTTKWLKENYPDIKILILSMYDDIDVVVQLLELGAHGYLTKTSDPDEIGCGIIAVRAGGIYFSSDIRNRVFEKVYGSNRKKDIPTNLTEKEIQLLKLFASELTIEEIAEKMYMGTRTVEGYRLKLLEKLHIKSRVGLAMYTMSMGILDS
jgi:two-component system invasion response regulator UvrY